MCNIMQYFALEKDVGPTLTQEGEETLSKGYRKWAATNQSLVVTMMSLK